MLILLKHVGDSENFFSSCLSSSDGDLFDKMYSLLFGITSLIAVFTNVVGLLSKLSNESLATIHFLKKVI